LKEDAKKEVTELISTTNIETESCSPKKPNSPKKPTPSIKEVVEEEQPPI
jgi:hypothetical protein